MAGVSAMFFPCRGMSSYSSDANFSIYLLYGQNGGRTTGEPYSNNDCAWTRLSIKPGIKKISRQTGPYCFS